MKMLALGTLLAALTVSPAVAQGHGPKPTRANPQSAYAAVTPFGSPATAGGPSQMNAAREQAIRACAVEARRYAVNTWGSMEGHQYRTCMAQRGQAE
jgi:hypothetical protein